MPIQYMVLDRGTFVYARAYGTLTVADLVEHESTVLEDPEVQSGYRQLLDCRWVKEDGVDGSAARALSEVHTAHRSRLNGSRYAIVTHSAQWFHMGAAYPSSHYGLTLIIFNDPSTACIWLGVDYENLADYSWLDRAKTAPSRVWMVEVPSPTV